jgi:hypothetical protein
MCTVGGGGLRSGPAGLAQLLVGEGVAVNGLLEEPLQQKAASA